MRGLLADVNVQGHLPYLRQLIDSLGLWACLSELGLDLAIFPELGLPRDLDDRSLWNRCQELGWVLLTENRNHDGPDSLHATLQDSWKEGHLPVLTLSNKGRFEHSRCYAEQVATDVAELLFGVANGQYRDQTRIFVPLTNSPRV
jgi:hypothetical protein